MDFGCDQPRLQLGIHFASPLQPGSGDSRALGWGGDERGSDKTIREEYDPPGAGRTRILQYVLPTTKEDRRASSYSKSSTPEPAPPSEVIQDGSLQQHSGVARDRPLGGLSGSDGRLFAHPRSSQSLEVSSLRSKRGRDLRVQGAMLRPSYSTASVHKSSGRSGRVPAEIGVSHLPVLGRLDISAPLQNFSRSAASHAVTSHTSTRFPGEFGKIRSGPQSTFHLPGSEVRPSGRPPVPFFRSHRQVTGGPSVDPAGRRGAGVRMASRPRDHGIMHRHRTLGQVTDETDSAVSPLPVVSSGPGHVQIHPSPSPCGYTSSLVGVDRPLANWRPVEASSVSANHGDGRQHGLGVGRLHSERTLCSGSVVSCGTFTSHKHPGDASSVQLPETVSRCGKEQAYSPPLRQHDSRILHKQARGHSLATPVLASLAPASLVPGERGASEGSPPGRSQEHSRGLSVSQGGFPGGVVSSQGSNGGHFRDTGQTTCGPIRCKGERQTANVLLVESGPAGAGDGRSGIRLDKVVRICIPPNLPDTESPAEDGRGEVPDHLDHSGVASEALVSPPPEPAVPSADTSSRAEGSAFATARAAMASKPRAVSVGGMAAVKRNYRQKGFSKVAAKLLANAVRGSTRSVYKSRFEEFARWCSRREIDPFLADLEYVINFLSTKFKNGLSYSTVAGYRSAISSYHVPVNNAPVGQHPLVVKLIRGVFNLRPPPRSLGPIWDLKLVLTNLRRSPFEPLREVSLKWCTRKTVLLVALASAGRSSDIAKLGWRSPHLRFESNPAGVRLIPRGLRKQDRPGHLLQDVFITAFQEDPKLDPVRAIRIYMSRVKDRRGDLESLFVTFGAKSVSSPSAQTIAHWIVDAIKQGLDSNARIGAHSTRSTSTTTALLKGVSVANIIRAADWAGSSTFARHYLREHREEEARFGTAVLQAARV